MRIAIIGGGWAGLAAAERALGQGHAVSLWEMSPVLGGRARSIHQHDQHFDNGQHILIGAYSHTLHLMERLGVDSDKVLQRLPLALTQPDGSGLALRSTSSSLAFFSSVMRHTRWTWPSRLRLLASSLGWAAKNFKCAETLTVMDLTRTLPQEVRSELIEPLCVAALNTPGHSASARVFLRVLRDALMVQRGGADLLLPKRPLQDLLPGPALTWLRSRGAQVHLRTRANSVMKCDEHWHVDSHVFDGVVLTCPATEAARLAQGINPGWSMLARSLPHASITTAYLSCPGAKLVSPMVFIPKGPAQFAFDHGALGMTPGRFAFVISAADDYHHLDRAALSKVLLEQAVTEFPSDTWPQTPVVVGIFTERRATFRCEPELARPPAYVAPRLWAAGDYVEGPYPSTIEGAVRSGQEAIERLMADAA